MQHSKGSMQHSKGVHVTQSGDLGHALMDAPALITVYFMEYCLESIVKPMKIYLSLYNQKHDGGLFTMRLYRRAK